MYAEQQNEIVRFSLLASHGREEKGARNKEQHIRRRRRERESNRIKASKQADLFLEKQKPFLSIKHATSLHPLTLSWLLHCPSLHQGKKRVHVGDDGVSMNVIFGLP
jgi:hypothetical protein